ncbi:hypothetical protein ALT_5443 [Aspergillus lentulus]|uniref:Uncharacterized protein n=1 Tax=Aspergillus lentulus TaxID=293939 RepID=A0AAN4TBN7_ASPLE|nr:uncharacterized protein IFM58399_00370 [Aspergillus lentulus]KAF4151020.1 hypothetical protein CNMCM6069_004760 [Aspergillus lentulus]KAF4165360.1 hypothetical protein CNMCM6936_007968 [Aspergillus lentulus]KAF4174232.1 hypothetical protein CNMCM8060_008892 [Aspergillus lentulus]KAF4185410.1 hypothetical protein CNMCM7927_006850 [Aspergillus lentulus]KAF4187637.1 hypothetical protein CNMCM8694_005383 [Aspergillus lentulus]
MSPSLQLNTRSQRDEKLPSCSSKTLVAAPPVESPKSPEDYDPCANAKPYSPFYRHATTSFALEQSKSQTKKPNCTVDAMNDLESAPSQTPYKPSMDVPGCRTSKLWTKKRNRCGCMQSLTRKQRMIVKAAIAIVTVGSMVAIALGITVAVGGGVWKSDHQQGAIVV